MTIPYQLPFIVPDGSTVITSVNPGATNDAPLDILKQHIHPVFRNKKGWGALLSAFAAGDTIVMDNNRTMFDQLFVSTASESYLDTKAADWGIRRATNLGIDDNYFRQLTITLSSLKVVSEALLECLRVFYGEDSTRGNITSSMPAPYTLVDGESVQFKINGINELEIPFYSEDFSDIASASASEVAVIMTRAFQYAKIEAYALPVTVEGYEYVRIYTKALGLRGSTVCVGGMAQSVFRFPMFYNPHTVTTTWDTTVSLIAGTATLDLTTGTVDNFYQIRAGDYVVSRMTNYTGTRSWRIRSIQWESISSCILVFDLNGDTLAAGVSTMSSNNFFFFRSLTSTVLDCQLPAYIAQPSDQYVDVVMPVTTLVVNRTAETGAYIQEGAHPHTTNYENGAWLLDPDGGVVVTSIETTTTIPLAKYTSVSHLPVDSTTGFSPDGGWIVLGFATKYQTSPIRYYGIDEGSSNLLVERSQFEQDIPSGISVTHLYQREPWIPTDIPGIAYVTASNAGVIEASRILDEIVAAGVIVNKLLQYPGDRGLAGEGTTKSEKVYVWGGDGS